MRKGRLAIGGHFDGKWQPVDARDVVVFAWSEPQPISPADAIFTPIVPTIRAERYKRATLAADGQEFDVWVFAGMSMAEVMRKLIEGYKP